MKALVRLIVVVFLSGLAVLPAQAAFSSLYAFGDGVSCTASNIYGGSYYPYTYSNGKIWVQVLAERLGLNFNATTNLSDEWHDSAINLTYVSQFSAADASTSLFVVWCNDADFVDDIQYGPYPSLNTSAWNTAINNSLNTHSSIISTLYAKGARSLVMPNAVDITKIPQYTYEQPLPSSDAAFIRQMITSFNTSFATILNQAMVAHPDLTIYAPDMFTLLNNMLANPGSYGLVNPGYAALENDSLNPWSLTGPGANYVFWDPYDPTAKAHAVMADITQQLIPQQSSSPAKITQIHYGNPCTISGTGSVSHPFALVSSTNVAKALNLWTREQTNTAGTGSFSFSVTPGVANARFFQVITQ
jgi:phospholipase/lecithinase/hemolysin